MVASFFLIACQVCIAVIEYYLVVTLASCLIPFGISQHTRFLAEKAIGAAVAVSVKLMVLSFVVALIQPVLGQLHYSSGGGEILLNESLAMCLVCILLAILVWRAPGFASDLLAASPSLSANAVGQHITSAVSTGAAAFSGGTSLGPGCHLRRNQRRRRRAWRQLRLPTRRVCPPSRRARWLRARRWGAGAGAGGGDSAAAASSTTRAGATSRGGTACCPRVATRAVARARIKRASEVDFRSLFRASSRQLRRDENSRPHLAPDRTC